MSWNDFTTRYISGSRVSPATVITTQDVMAVTSIIAWTALTPAGTALTVETALSLDGGNTWTDWQMCTNGEPLLGIDELSSLQNVQLKTRVSMTTTNVHVTPELQDLTIDIITAWTTVVYGPEKSTLTAWDSISLAWDSDRLSLVVNDSEAAYIEDPELPAALGSYLHIGTDRDGSSAIGTLVDELRIDKASRDVATRVGWHKTGTPFYTSEDMKQWPGYLRAETDGLKVYDSFNALRVLLGSWVKDEIRKYGIKIIDGEFYAGYIKTAGEFETSKYVEIGQTSNRGYINLIGDAGNRSLRLQTSGDQGTVSWYNSAGEEIAKIYPNGSVSVEMLFSSDTGLSLSTWFGEKITMGPNGSDTSARGIKLSGVSADIIPYTNDVYYLGESGRKWSDIYAHYVHTGDLCFEEKSCPICEGLFAPGEVLTLLVTAVEGSTYCIPVHDRCKELSAEIEVRVPEFETQYTLNERGETIPVRKAAMEECEEEIITIHPDYTFDEKVGKFFRKDNEENARIFDAEELKRGIDASRHVALATDTVLKRKPKYRKLLLKVN